MNHVIFFVLISVGLPGLAQQQTYDLITFTPPAGWNKTSNKNMISFSTVDQVQGTWAQISIVSATSSQGTIEGDFQSEWTNLAVKPYSVSEKPLEIEKQVFNGWNVWTGLGRFTFNNETANLLLSTFSNGQRCASVIMMSNTDSYGSVINEFSESIQLPPAMQSNGNLSPVSGLHDEHVTPAPTSPMNDGFQFNVTNFDDGWTSVVKEDWVEATKGNIKVLLHYPRKEDSEYYPRQIEQTRLFWNLLVAPRYVSASEFFLYEYNNSFEPGLFASAYLTDKSGRKQFVALFSKGKSGWVEIITPDKATFVNAFGVDQPDSFFDKWQPLVNLTGLNRFAVAASDLKGKWSSDFSSSMQYYSTFTGMYAGYHAYSSRVVYVFGKNNTYEWDIGSANSVNGQTDVQTARSSGTFTMKGNWQMVCSKIQNGPKTYNVYFSCIKGGRILWIQDVEYGSYTAFGKSAD